MSHLSKPVMSEIVDTALNAAARKTYRKNDTLWRYSACCGDKDQSWEGTALLHQERWLILRAPLDARSQECSASAHDLWRLVASQNRLAGGLKYAFNGAGSKVLIQKDIFLDHDCVRRLKETIRKTFSGFLLARTSFCALEGDQSEAVETEIPSGGGGKALAEFASMCAEAGWSCSETPEGTVKVGLDGAGEYCQAVLENANGCGIRARVKIIPETGSGKDCTAAVKEALGIFCLTINGSVKLARAGVNVNAESGLEMNFEVCFQGGGCPASIHHGLSALSVLSRNCASEIRLITDPDVAARYMTMRQWPALAQKQPAFSKHIPNRTKEVTPWVYQ